MRLAFCDDQAILVNKLSIQVENLIEQNNYYHFFFEYFVFTNPETLYLEHKKHPFDIVFLDIDMPNMNGFTLADKLFDVNNEIFILFVTSYNQFAISSIKHRVYRFILKNDALELEDSIKQILSDLSMMKSRYRFKFKNQAYSLPYHSILYLEAIRNKIFIHTKSKNYEQLTTLKKVLPELPECFCRCHHGYIVNMTHVVQVDKTSILLTNETLIPVSKKYSKDILMKMLTMYE